VTASEPWLNTPELRLRTLLERLTEAEVDFVVVGGVAVITQASPRFTKDLDICYAHEPANLQRLGAALVGLGARLRGVEEDAADPQRAMACELARTSPDAPSACTANTGAALGTGMAVSKPAEGVVASVSSVAGVAPPSTLHALTPVAPFQLA